MTILMRKTRLVSIDGKVVEVRAYPEHGAWYERRGDIGEFHAPMEADGGLDPWLIGQVEELYPRRECQERFCNAAHEYEEG